MPSAFVFWNSQSEKHTYSCLKPWQQHLKTETCLCFAMTDSFVLKIDGIDDVNSILWANRKSFDFSNLPLGHALKDDTFRMCPGYMKFELGYQICFEFCGLSPKCYSIRTSGGFKQTAKWTKLKMAHELYKKKNSAREFVSRQHRARNTKLRTSAVPGFN